MSYSLWTDPEFQQQHRVELIREAEMRRLAKKARSGSVRTNSALQTLLYAAGHTLVSVGERLQSQTAEINPAIKQN